MVLGVNVGIYRSPMGRVWVRIWVGPELFGGFGPRTLDPIPLAGELKGPRAFAAAQLPIGRGGGTWRSRGFFASGQGLGGFGR